jgi:hypothetical protein
MPWDVKDFIDRHNKKATAAQGKVGAERANKVLAETGDEGKAVRAGNATIKAVRNNARKKRHKK